MLGRGATNLWEKSKPRGYSMLAAVHEEARPLQILETEVLVVGLRRSDTFTQVTLDWVSPCAPSLLLLIQSVLYVSSGLQPPSPTEFENPPK